MGTNKTQKSISFLNFWICAEEMLRRCTMVQKSLPAFVTTSRRPIGFGIPTPTGNALDWILAGRWAWDLKSQPSSCCKSSQCWSKKGETLLFNEEWKEGRSRCEVCSRRRELSGALFRVFSGSPRTSHDVDSCSNNLSRQKTGEFWYSLLPKKTKLVIIGGSSSCLMDE